MGGVSMGRYVGRIIRVSDFCPDVPCRTMFDRNAAHDALHERAVVAAVTHDHARIWLLNGESSDPMFRLERPSDSPHRHVWPAQSHHGHASDTAEPSWFADLEHVLGSASTVVLVGHGKGKGNEVERFMGHLVATRSPLLARVVGTGVANLPAMTDAEIIAAARERWAARYL